MNKHIQLIKNIILLVVLTGFMSCDNDFLERYPLTSISDGGFWVTATDLRLYVNNFYNSDDLLPSYTWSTDGGPFSIDANEGSDIKIALEYNRRMNGENTVPASGGGWDWGTLRKINYFLDNYKKSTESWEAIKEYVGEALFFRSIFYFNKLKSFGDLPWISTVLRTDSEELFDARLPRNQVVDSIMYDLDRAVEYLPERSAWTGRLTKETAMLLQARIALFEGTWEKYHALKNTPFKTTGSDGSKFIRKAADVSGALMVLAEKNGATALVDGMNNGYTNIFNQLDYSTNKEVLFWRKYSASENVSHRFGRVLWSGAGNGITKSMVDSYLCIDGNPISVSPLYQGDKDLMTVVANRDPRMIQSINVDDGKHVRWTQNNTFFQYPTFNEAFNLRDNSGYSLYKGNRGDYVEYQSMLCYQGVIYGRYAEALLIYAEARAELGEITQNDIDKTINALRRRVGMNEGLLNMNSITADPKWEFSGISPILNEIRRERKVELICEGFRHDDIYRWAAADEIIVGKRPKGATWEQWRDYPDASDIFLSSWAVLPVDEDGYIDPYRNFPALNNGYRFNLNRDYLSPLSTNDLTLNSKLKQNPGWE